MLRVARILLSDPETKSVIERGHQFRRNRDLADVMPATLERLEGDDPAETLLDFTRRNGVTQIFLSKPPKAAAPVLGRRNFVMDVVRLAKDRQVTVVADRRRVSAT